MKDLTFRYQLESLMILANSGTKAARRLENLKEVLTRCGAILLEFLLPHFPVRKLLLILVSAFLFISLSGQADGKTVRLAHDLTVGAANDVHLKAGQVVGVLTDKGAALVISVQLSDGSSGINQVDASAVTVETTAAPSPLIAPPVTTNAAPSAPMAQVPPAPSTAMQTANPVTNVVSDPNLPEDQVTLIHVSCPQGAALFGSYVKLYPVSAGSYSYRLYLPPGYYEHPTFRYPALFIMSPEGNASLGAFEIRAREEGWIVVMFVEAKNGDWGPIFGDMLATHADVISKMRIQDGLKFATGFSGGARGTSILCQIIPGFNGELLQGAGFAYDDAAYHLDLIPKDNPFAVFFAMGKDDSNFHEIDDLKGQLHGVPLKCVTFEGGHMPAPTATVNQGFDWMIEKSLSGDSLSDDLRRCGARQFIFLAKRLESDPNNPNHAADMSALVAIGENLNLRSGSAEALELKKLKDLLPLMP